MKFKYVGKPIGNVSFVNAGIINRGEKMKTGKIYNIPDNDLILVNACLTNAAYQLIEEKKKSKKSVKKEDKEEK